MTGAVLLGHGTYHYQPEADKVFEGTFRAAMLRFNPHDQSTLLPLDEATKTNDPGAAEMARHLLNVVFRHCWHRGMEALIPPEGTLAAVLYTKEQGDLLISLDSKSAVYDFTNRTALYEKK